MTSRDHWLLDASVTFLNHGSFGACPRVVLEAQRALRDRLEAQPISFFIRELEGLAERVRVELGVVLGARPEDLGFVPNTTFGCNAVLSSFPFEPGDEVLITNHGYNAVNNAATRWASARGATVKVAKIPMPVRSPDDVVAAITEAINERTRLLIIDWVTSPTALVLPIAEVCTVAGALGVRTLVDAAHAPGMVRMDLATLGADYVTGNLHKWLCAPKAAAFLWVRRGLQAEVRPAVISHGANSTRADRSRFQLEFDWTGTGDPTPLLVVPEAIAFLRGLSGGDLDAHMAENRALALAGRKLLADRLGAELPAPDEMIGSMASVPLPDRPASDVSAPPTFVAPVDPLHDRLIDRHRVEVPIMNWPAADKRLVRISAQRYNTLADYERLADALLTELGPRVG